MICLYIVSSEEPSNPDRFIAVKISGITVGKNSELIAAAAAPVAVRQKRTKVELRIKVNFAPRLEMNE